MQKLRLSVAAALMIVSLAALGWGLSPAHSRPRILLLTPSDMMPPGLLPAARTSATSEPRQLALQYPSWIRVGDSSVIRLTLDAASVASVTPLAAAGGNLSADPSVASANAYEAYDVIAEARLDLEGMEVRPSAAVREPLLPGDTAEYRWSVRTTEEGMYRGTAWLILVFVDKANGQQRRVAVSAQPVQIRATSLLGLGGGAARVLGGLGTMAAAVLSIPFAVAGLKRFRSRPRTEA